MAHDYLPMKFIHVLISILGRTIGAGVGIVVILIIYLMVFKPASQPVNRRFNAIGSQPVYYNENMLLFCLC